MKDNTGETALVIALVDKTPTMTSFEQEFANSYQSNYSELDHIMIDYNFMGSMWIQDTFCSTFPAAPALTNGSVDQSLCFEYDDVMQTFAFNPITMNGCTDTGNLITYEINVAGILEPEYFKISADSIDNVIRFTALNGGSVTGTHTLTVVGTLPDSVTQASFTFDVIFNSCSK